MEFDCVGSWSLPFYLLNCLLNFYIRTRTNFTNAQEKMMQKIIWASSWNYCTCHIGDQQRLRRACASAQSPQSLCCSHTMYGIKWRVRPNQNLAHCMAAHEHLKNEFMEEDEKNHNLMTWLIWLCLQSDYLKDIHYRQSLRSWWTVRTVSYMHHHLRPVTFSWTRQRVCQRCGSCVPLRWTLHSHCRSQGNALCWNIQYMFM